MSYSMNSINLLKKLCVMIFVASLIVFMNNMPVKAYTNSKDLKAHENNANGLPIYNNKTITVRSYIVPRVYGMIQPIIFQ